MTFVARGVYNGAPTEVSWDSDDREVYSDRREVVAAIHEATNGLPWAWTPEGPSYPADLQSAENAWTSMMKAGVADLTVIFGDGPEFPEEEDPPGVYGDDWVH